MLCDFFWNVDFECGVLFYGVYVFGGVCYLVEGFGV